MGCKQSKYAIGDEGQGYMDGHDPYKGDPADMDAMYGAPGLQTDIIPAHRYIGGGSYPGSEQLSQKPMVPQPEQVNNGMCPSDAQYAQMAESCATGILEMFSLGNNQKAITNGPANLNAYQQPAYNYQTPPSSEHSLGNHSQTHSQSSQRRAVMVQNGSYSL